MDSPRPMTLTILTTKDCRSVPRLSAHRTPRVEAIEARAPIRGIPAARKPPKTSTMTSRASGRETASPCRRSRSTWSLTAASVSRWSETMPAARASTSVRLSGTWARRASTRETRASRCLM